MSAKEKNPFLQKSSSAFTRFWDWLRGSNRQIPRLAKKKSVSRFLDAKVLNQHYQPAEVGWKDGGENHPPVESQDFSTFESMLISQSNKALLILREEVKRESVQSAHVTSKFESRISLDSLEAKLHRLKIEFGIEITSETKAKLSDILELKKQELKSEAHLKWFREFHERRLDAKKPQGTRFVVLFLSLLVVIEAAINMSYFRDAAPAGLVNGFQIAISISALNVFLSYGVGFNFTKMAYYLWKRHPIKRLVGAFVTGFWIVIALPIAHQAVGKYRDHIEKSKTVEEIANFDMKAALTSNLFDFSQMESWWLVAIGIALGGLALTHGAKLSSDLYPGYSDAWRNWNDAKKDVETSIKNLYLDTGKVERKVIDSAEKLVVQHNDASDEFRAALSNFEFLVEAYDECRHQIEMAFIQTIDTYRRANILVRTTVAPGYFLVAPELDASMERDFADASVIIERLSSEKEIALDYLSRFRSGVRVEAREAREQVTRYISEVGASAQEVLESNDFYFLQHRGADLMSSGNPSESPTIENGEEGRKG